MFTMFYSIGKLEYSADYNNFTVHCFTKTRTAGHRWSLLSPKVPSSCALTTHLMTHLMTHPLSVSKRCAFLIIIWFK